MTRRLPNWKTDTEAIRRVLLNDWNPIGFDVPEDEYDVYIPQIYRMIQERNGVDQLALALDAIESGQMGLPVNHEQNRRVAELLFKLGVTGTTPK